MPLYSEALSDNKGLQFSKSFTSFSVIKIIGTAWAFTEKTDNLSQVFSPSCTLTFGHIMLMLGKNKKANQNVKCTQRGCRTIILAHKTIDFWCFYGYCHGHCQALYYRLVMNNPPLMMEGCPRLRQIIILLLFDTSKRFVGCCQLSLFSVQMVFKQIANCFFSWQ